MLHDRRVSKKGRSATFNSPTGPAATCVQEVQLDITDMWQRPGRSDATVCGDPRVLAPHGEPMATCAAAIVLRHWSTALRGVFFASKRPPRTHTKERVGETSIQSLRREGLRERKLGQMCKPSPPEDDVTSPAGSERYLREMAPGSQLCLLTEGVRCSQQQASL